MLAAVDFDLDTLGARRGFARWSGGPGPFRFVRRIFLAARVRPPARTAGPSGGPPGLIIRPMGFMPPRPGLSASLLGRFLLLALGLLPGGPAAAGAAPGGTGLPDVRGYLRGLPDAGSQVESQALAGALVGALGLPWAGDDRLTPVARVAISPDRNRILLAWGGQDRASGACTLAAVVLDSCGRTLTRRLRVPGGWPLISNAGAAAFHFPRRVEPDAEPSALVFLDREGRVTGTWRAPAEADGVPGTCAPPRVTLLHSGQGALFLTDPTGYPARNAPCLYFISHTGTMLWRHALSKFWRGGVYLSPNDSLFVLHGSEGSYSPGDKILPVVQVLTPGGTRVMEWRGHPGGTVRLPLVDPTGMYLFMSTEGPAVRAWSIWRNGMPVPPDRSILRRMVDRGTLPEGRTAQQLHRTLGLAGQDPTALPNPGPSCPPGGDGAVPSSSVGTYLRRAADCESPATVGALAGRLGLDLSGASGCEKPYITLFAATSTGYGLIHSGCTGAARCSYHPSILRGTVCLFDTLGRISWSRKADLEPEPLLAASGAAVLFDQTVERQVDSLGVWFLDPEGHRKAVWAAATADWPERNGNVISTAFLAPGDSLVVLFGNEDFLTADWPPERSPRGPRVRAIDTSGHERWTKDLPFLESVTHFTNVDGTRLMTLGRIRENRPPEARERWGRRERPNRDPLAMPWRLLSYDLQGTPVTDFTFRPQERVFSLMALPSDDGLRLLHIREKELRALDVRTGRSLGLAPRAELEALAHARHRATARLARQMLAQLAPPEAAPVAPR